jgi:hypothetical protein
MSESVKDLVDRMSVYEVDHLPEGWPAIKMKDVSALCDAVMHLAKTNSVDLEKMTVAETRVKP